MLKNWLELVFQGKLAVWYSNEALQAGETWFRTIVSELRRSSFVVVCLTSESQKSPWVWFECGAVATAFEKARVCPLLINVGAKAVPGPLSQYQHVGCDESGFAGLVRSINNVLHLMDASAIDKQIKALGPVVQAGLEKMDNRPMEAGPEKSTEEMISEIFDTVRDLAWLIHSSLPLGGGAHLGERDDLQAREAWARIGSLVSLQKKLDVARDRRGQRQYDDAMKLYEEVLAEDRANEEALVGKIVTASYKDGNNIGTYLRCIDELEKITKTYPHCARAYYNRACLISLVMRGQKKYPAKQCKDMQRDLEKSVRYYPRYASVAFKDPDFKSVLTLPCFSALRRDLRKLARDHRTVIGR